MDKEQDELSNSETTPPEDERDELIVTDRIKLSRSLVFDHDSSMFNYSISLI